MTIQTDITNFREDNSITESQLSNAKALRFYNESRDFLIDKIIKEKEDFFYDEQTTNLVQGQREYTFSKRGDLAGDLVTVLDGLSKIKAISIKKKATDTEYTPVTFKALENLESDFKSYTDNTDPFCVILDNSWFLCPPALEDIPGGATVYGIFYPKKVALTDNETEILDQYQKAVFLGVLSLFYKGTQKFEEYKFWRGEFERECERVSIMLSGRIQGPVPREIPNLNHLS